MKIKTVSSTYKSVMAMKKEERKKPLRPNPVFRTLLCVLSWPTLKKTHFRLEKIGMDRLKKKENALFLMNHSSFIDLKIASSILYPRPFNIICEADGFVGKEGLMRAIGCIPTHKFVSETVLVKDMMYAARNLKNSILLYPEASYSFDGTTPTPLPESLGKMVKLLKIPVVMIETFGAFHRDPLYNRLQLRKVDVSAKMEYLLSPDEINKMSVEDINALIAPHFSFDHYLWQKDNGIKIREDFRADGLSSVLYKCPHCLKEGDMESSGTTIKCTSCLKEWRLEEDGSLKAVEGEEYFTSIPSWSRWERREVEKEIEEVLGKNRTDSPKVLSLLASTSYLKAKNSSSSVMGAMLKDLGCINLADSESSLLENLSIEYILQEDPEYIFITQRGDDTEGMKKAVEKYFQEHPLWYELSAVKEGKVFFMDKNLYNLKPNNRWGEAYRILQEILTDES